MACIYCGQPINKEDLKDAVGGEFYTSKCHKNCCFLAYKSDVVQNDCLVCREYLNFDRLGKGKEVRINEQKESFERPKKNKAKHRDKDRDNE